MRLLAYVLILAWLHLGTGIGSGGLGHFAAFAGYAVVASTSLRLRHQRPQVVLASGLVLGFVLEGVQSLVGRDASVGDLIVDVAGLSVGLVLVALWEGPRA